MIGLNSKELSLDAKILEKFGLNVETAQKALVQFQKHKNNLKLAQDNADLDKAYEELLGTFVEGLKQFWLSIRRVGLEIGRTLIPMIEPLIRIATTAIDSFAKLLEVTPKWVKQIAAGGITIVAVAGAVSLFIGALKASYRGVASLAIGAGMVKPLTFILSLLPKIGTALLALRAPLVALRSILSGLAIVANLNPILSTITVISLVSMTIYRQLGWDCE